MERLLYGRPRTTSANRQSGRAELRGAARHVAADFVKTDGFFSAEFQLLSES